jgi:hypothetical protein
MRGPLSFSDARWATITSHISEPLCAEADARLRSAVMECCSRFETERTRLEEGRATAAAMRAGKRRPAPFERLTKGLRMASDAWSKIGNIHDDRLGDLAQ